MKKYFFTNRNFLIALSLVPFAYISFLFIRLDFWNDEIYSLRFFTLVPFRNILTDYHVPNNHIFYNLINHVYLRIIGCTDIHSLMDKPQLLRLLPWIYSIGTLYFTFRTSAEFISRFAAILSISILLTTLPFYNFFLQIRGYGLSMFLLSMVVYYALRINKNFYLPEFVVLIISTGLLIYTVPVNLYYVLSALIFFLIPGIKKGINSVREHELHKWTQLVFNNQLKICFAFAFGIAFALVLYIPVFNEVFYNKYVESQKGFRSIGIFNDVASAMISGRVVLPFMCFAGLVLILFELDSVRSILLKNFLFLLFIFLFPFVITIVRNDPAPDRSFVILAPVFSITMASGTYFFISVFPRWYKIRNFILLLLVAYSAITFLFCFKSSRHHLKKDIIISKRSQVIMHNYYLAYYQPDRLAKDLADTLEKKPAPLFLLDGDYYAMREYLKKHHLRFVPVATADSVLMQISEAYFVTNHPYAFEADMHSRHPDFLCQRLNRFTDFHNIYRCRKIE